MIANFCQICTTPGSHDQLPVPGTAHHAPQPHSGSTEYIEHRVMYASLSATLLLHLHKRVICTWSRVDSKQSFHLKFSTFRLSHHIVRSPLLASAYLCRSVQSIFSPNTSHLCGTQRCMPAVNNLGSCSLSSRSLGNFCCFPVA